MSGPFTCFERDRDVRTQIYLNGNAVTMGEVADVLNESCRSREAFRLMQQWGHYLNPLRFSGNLAWRLRTPLGYDFDLGWQLECDKKSLSFFTGCFADPAEALIVGAERLEQERKE